MDGSQLLEKSLPNEMDAWEGKYSRSRKPIGQVRVEVELCRTCTSLSHTYEVDKTTTHFNIPCPEHEILSVHR
jgi:hypothetical protein